MGSSRDDVSKILLQQKGMQLRSHGILSLIALISMIHNSACFALRTFRSAASFPPLKDALSSALGTSRLLQLRLQSTVADELVQGRYSSKGLTLDVDLIANRPEIVVSHLKARRADEEQIQSVDRIGVLAKERKALIQVGDKARGFRKQSSQQIFEFMKAKQVEQAEQLKAEVEAANKEITETDEKLLAVDNQLHQLFLRMPNLLDDSVVDGQGEADNVVVSEWGTERRMVGENYRWHDDLASQLGGLDLGAAARISGARFAVLYGPLARLERAITQYFMDSHSERGYMEVTTPFLVSQSTLQGTGQLPKFEDDLFQVNHNIGGEKAYLIPTAEVPMTALFREQILTQQELPLALVANTPCFRAEAGSHGRDTRGLLRQHQFQKVEMVKVTAPDESEQEHEKMVQDAEFLLQQLELPYRKVKLCSGDVGFSARLCYDLEVWLPGQQTYREISSISNCYDYQARRMQLRYRPAEAKKPVLCHTLNGSGLAVGRTIVAILENYQRPDGSVEIPKVLQPYMGGLTELKPATRHEHARAKHSRTS